MLWMRSSPCTIFFKRHLRWWALKSRYTEGSLESYSSFQIPHNGRFTGGVGGSPRSSGGSVLGPVVSSNQTATHQRIRTTGSLAQSTGSYGLSGGLLSPGVFGQLDNCCVPQQTGGHQVSDVVLLTRQILIWCRDHRVVLSAIHISGKSNVLADYLSRGSGPVPNEWTLSQWVCNAVLATWGNPWLDLFATRVNHRLPLYVSPMQDLHAWGVDALAFSWRSLDAYAFLHLLLIPTDPGQDPEGPGSSNSNRPLLAIQELVLSSHGATGRASSQSTRVKSAAVTAQRKSSLSKRGKTIPSRMEVIRQSLRRDGFSTKAAEVIAKCRRLPPPLYMTQGRRILV